MDITMIDHLDHLVLTTNHEEACVRFYVELLGMRLETFAQGRKAFVFGNQKINLHIRGKSLNLKPTRQRRGRWICVLSPRVHWKR